MVSRQPLLEEQSLSSLTVDQLRILLRDGNGLYRSFLFEGIDQDKSNGLIFVLLFAFLFLQTRLIALLFNLADLKRINLDRSIDASCYYELSPCS